MNSSETIISDPAFPYTQVRIARPTNRLAEVIRFYTEGLRLK